MISRHRPGSNNSVSYLLTSLTHEKHVANISLFAPTEKDLKTLLRQEEKPTLIRLDIRQRSPGFEAPVLDTTSLQAMVLSSVLRCHVEPRVAQLWAQLPQISAPSPATTASFNPLKNPTEAQFSLVLVQSSFPSNSWHARISTDQ